MDEDVTLDGTESLSLYRSGRDAHPEIELPFPQFAEATARVGPTGGPRLSHAADFYLAAACDAGSELGWSRIEGTVNRSIRPILLARRMRADVVGEVVSTLPGFLSEPPPRGGARTRLGTYAGLSKLSSWLSIVAMRRAADLIRSRGTTEELPRLADPGRSPYQTLADRETRARFATALERGLQQLTSRERLAVLFRFRDGLPQREIAVLMGVGAPRVSQLLAAGTARLRTATRGALVELDPSGHEALWNGLRDEIRIALATSARSSD